MTQQGLSLVVSLCIFIQHVNAWKDPCEATKGGLAGVKLGMKLSEIVKVLGPGRLEYKYDGDLMDTRSSYSWRKGGFHIDVNFGEDSRAHGIIVGSRAKLSLLGRVRLNVDTYAQIVKPSKDPNKPNDAEDIDPQKVSAEERAEWDPWRTCDSVRHDVAFVFWPQGRQPNLSFAKLNTQPTNASVYASTAASRRHPQNSWSGRIATPFL